MKGLNDLKAFFARVRVSKRLLLRYALCFFLSMLIPIAAFGAIYQRVFVKDYEAKLLDQYRDQHALTLGSLNALMESVQKVKSSYALQACMRPYHVKNSVTAYSEIAKVLANTLASNSGFQDIAYYTAATPDTVYTGSGTYNLTYFKKYSTGNGLWIDLGGVSREVIGGAWFTRSQILWEHALPAFDYLTPLNSERTSFVLFSFDSGSLAGLLSHHTGPAYLLTQEGNILYPGAQEIPEWLLSEQARQPAAGTSMRTVGEGYVLSSPMAEGALHFVQLYPYSMFETGIGPIHRSFAIAIGGLSLLSVFLINLFTIASYRPIQRLNRAVAGKVGRMTPEGDEIGAAVQALETLETRYEDLHRDVRSSRSLLWLMYNSQPGETRDQMLSEAGLPQNPRALRVLAVYLPEEGQAAQWKDVRAAVEASFLSKVQATGMEYIEERCFLFVLQGDVQSRESFSAAVNAFHQKLMALTEETCVLSLSGACADYGGLKDMYHEAMTAVQVHPDARSPLWCEDMREDLRAVAMPEVEIQSFENAIAFADMEKLQMLTDALIDSVVRINEVNPYLAVSLGFDILRRGMDAIGELTKPERDSGFIRQTEQAMKQARSIQDITGLIRLVKLHAGEVMTEIRPRQDYGRTMNEIFHFINENYQSNMLYAGAIAERFGLSISNLSHQFRSCFGITLHAHISHARMRYAKELLMDGSLTIQQIADTMGFTQPSSFIRKFKAVFGCTPKEYREQANT